METGNDSKCMHYIQLSTCKMAAADGLIFG